jgi:hypothetical protein
MGLPASSCSRPASRLADGPYAETRQPLGAFLLVEADNLHEAARIARLHPGDPCPGGIEVRPITYLERI